MKPCYTNSILPFSDPQIPQQKKDRMDLDAPPLGSLITQTAIPIVVKSGLEALNASQNNRGTKRKKPELDFCPDQENDFKRFKFAHEDPFSTLPDELIFHILNLSQGAGFKFLETCPDYQKLSKKYLRNFSFLLIQENILALNPVEIAKKGKLDIFYLLPITYSLYASFDSTSALEIINKHFNAEALKKLQNITKDHKRDFDFVGLKEKCLLSICLALAPHKTEEAIKCSNMIIINKNLLIEAMFAIYIDGKLSPIRKVVILNQIEEIIKSFDIDDYKYEATLSLVKIYALDDLSKALSFTEKMPLSHTKIDAYTHISKCYAYKGQFIFAYKIATIAHKELLNVVQEYQDESVEFFDNDFATIAELIAEINYIKFKHGSIEDNKTVYLPFTPDDILDCIVDFATKNNAMANVISIIGSYDPFTAYPKVNFDEFSIRPLRSIVEGMLKIGLNVEAEKLANSKPQDDYFSNSLNTIIIKNLAYTDFETAYSKTLSLNCPFSKIELLMHLAKLCMEKNRNKAIKIFELALDISKENDNHTSYLISNIATAMAPYFLEKALKEINSIEDLGLRVISRNSIITSLVKKLELTH